MVVTLIGVAGAGYFYFRYQQAKKEIQTIKTDPTTIQKAAEAESKKLVVEVSKLIDLPAGEDPTVATVTDVEKLKDQAFFHR